MNFAAGSEQRPPLHRSCPGVSLDAARVAGSSGRGTASRHHPSITVPGNLSCASELPQTSSAPAARVLLAPAKQKGHGERACHRLPGHVTPAPAGPRSRVVLRTLASWADFALVWDGNPSRRALPCTELTHGRDAARGCRAGRCQHPCSCLDGNLAQDPAGEGSDTLPGKPAPPQ